MTLLSADTVTRQNRSVVRLWYAGGRSEYADSFFPYTYLVASKSKIDDLLRSLPAGHVVGTPEVVERQLNNANVKAHKISTYRTSDIPLLRSAAEAAGVPCYESDILFHRRYLIDEDIKPMRDWSPETTKICSIDIETNSESGFFPRPTRDKIIVVSISWVGKDGTILRNAFHAGDMSETDLLVTVTKFLKTLNPDIVFHYNGTRFDIPYIATRAKILGVTLDWGRDGTPLRQGKDDWVIAGRANIDLFHIMRRDYQELKDKRLKTVCDVLGLLKKKDRVLIEGRKIPQMWKTDRERLLRYATDDAVGTLLLGQLVLPAQAALARYTNLIVQEAAHSYRGRQVEMFFIAQSKFYNALVPNKQHAAKVDFQGGVVFDPPKGLVENVRIIDIAATYPSIIIAHNISPETLCLSESCKLRHHVSPEKCHRFHYMEDQMGFTRNVTALLLQIRKPLKQAAKELTKDTPEQIKAEAEQYSLKVLANSVYGYMSSEHSRWYAPQCGEAIVEWARYYIRESAKLAERKYGVRPLYADTDSLFVYESEIIDTLLSEINTTFPVVMETEDVFPRVFFTGAKKRYVAINRSGKLKVRGLESRRGDWCNAAKRVQDEVIDAILRSESTEIGVKAALKASRIAVANLRKHRVDPEDLIISKSLTMEPEEYKGLQPHLSALLRAVEEVDASEFVDSKIEYVVVRGESPRVSDRTVLATLVEDVNTIDYDWYIRKQVVPAALRVLEPLGVSEAEILGQESLKQWIS